MTRVLRFDQLLQLLKEFLEVCDLWNLVRPGGLLIASKASSLASRSFFCPEMVDVDLSPRLYC